MGWMGDRSDDCECAGEWGKTSMEGSTVEVKWIWLVDSESVLSDSAYVCLGSCSLNILVVQCLQSVTLYLYTDTCPTKTSESYLSTAQSL